MAKKIKLAIVAQTDKVSATELDAATSAFQKQLDRDFTPHWQIEASLEVWPRRKRVAAGYWPVFIRSKLDDDGYVSYHSIENNRPFCMIAATPEWTVSASHDIMEMLVDPLVARVARSERAVGGRRKVVEYALQVCDPCASSWYSVDGIAVQNFTTPAYWEARRKPGAALDHQGVLEKPLPALLPGGYLSWRPSARAEWRMLWGKGMDVESLGELKTETTLGSGQRLRGRLSLLIKEDVTSFVDRTQLVVAQLIRDYGR